MLSLFHFSCLGSSAPASPPRPHIVLFVVDDLGWGDVSFHREVQTREVQTPFMASLVKDGIELTRQYLASSCSPSRAALISGRFPPHVNALLQEPTVANPNDTMSGWQGIPRNMTGLGSVMRAGDYYTAQVGKWDCGMATPQHTPMGRGFDSSLCYFHHANDYFSRTEGSCRVVNGTAVQSGAKPGVPHTMVDMWRDNGPAVKTNASAGGSNGTYEEDIFLAEALRIIRSIDNSSRSSSSSEETSEAAGAAGASTALVTRAKKQQPLFLYYAAHVVHEPYEVTWEYESQFQFINVTSRRMYHSMVKCIDDVIKSLVNELKTRNMWDQTLFVLSTDNGGPIGKNAGANNYPLRGGKYSNWEGGVRGTAFVSGGFLPQAVRGTVLRDPIHVADYYTTFAALAGVDPTDVAAKQAGLPPIDGVNLWPRLSGATQVPPRHEIYGDGLHSSYGFLINGTNKLILGTIPFAVWTGPMNPNETDSKVNNNWNCSSCTPPVTLSKVDCTKGCLYDVEVDPSERVELSATQPEARDALLARLLHLINTTAFTPNRGVVDPRACDVGVHKYGNFWGPFAFI